MLIQAEQYSDIGGRRENEDAVACRSYGQNLVAVLADGLGGQGDGSIASRLICDSLIGCGADNVFPDKLTVTRAFDEANRYLLSRQKNSFHMKTTAVYLCVCENRAIWAHVGDSRLYHFHEGRLCDFTLDHSASQLAVLMGQLEREDIPNDPGRNRLLRALGVEGEYPDVHEPVTLEKGRHVFLLCSDGVWEYFRDEELARLSREADSPQSFLRCLAALKNERSSENCDNNSAIAVFLQI